MKDATAGALPPPVGNPAPRDALALLALRQCMTGDTAGGAALYQRATEAPGGAELPVGVHARLLAGSGLAEAASLVWRAGQRVGADLSTCPPSRPASPQAAIAEYEQLFASGVGNAVMVANYLVWLGRAGASDRIAAVTDPRTLFRQTTLPIEEPIAPFLDRVAAALLGASGRQFQRHNKSIRNMDRVANTQDMANPDLVALHEAVGVRVAEYIADVAAAGHLIARWLPTAARLRSWAVLSDGAGYNAPHIHTGCWITAVAYIAGQARHTSDVEGALRIGPPIEQQAAPDGWPDLTVAAVPGTVVLMPAYYTHWTAPWVSTEPSTAPRQQSGLRISVAFNVSDGAKSRPLPLPDRAS